MVADLLPNLPVSTGSLEPVVEELGDLVDRAIALEVLAPPLPRWWIPSPVSQREQKEDERFSLALGRLAVELASLAPSDLYPVTHRLLVTLAAGYRSSLLVDLRRMAPIMGALADPDGLVELVEGLEHATDWWP